MNSYILVITLHADPAMPAGYEEWGGTHAYMREMLDLFTRRHINSVLITRQSMNGLAQYEEYSPYCRIYRLLNGNKPQTDKHTLPYYHQENVEKITEIIISENALPTCIHSVYWNSGRIAMELSKRFHIPFVHSVISNSIGRNLRGAKPDIPERSIYENQIYDAAKYILCVSDDEKEDLVHLYNVDSNKILVAGQAIGNAFLFPMHDANGFPLIGFTNNINKQHDLLNDAITRSHPSPPNNDDFWSKKAFTYFGRMATDKGVDIIVRAWCELYGKYRDICPPLWIVGGSTAEIEEIRNIVKKNTPYLESAENTRKLMWWGYLNSIGVSTVLLKTIVLLTHSRYEPGGRVVLEAMAEGIPTIATANGFAKDIIRDWHNGFIVTYGDISDLKRKMEFFIRQPYLTDYLGENAHSDALSYYDDLHFEEYHLYAYGLLSDLPHSKHRDTSSCVRSLNGSLNIYPYTFTSLSENYIKSFIKKETGQDTFKDNNANIKSTSVVSRFISKNANYYIKQFTTRMSTNAIFNPVLQNEKVRHARERFLCEKEMFIKMQHPYYVGSDDENLMLLLKEIPNKLLPVSEYLSLCISHLSNDYRLLSISERQVVATLFRNRSDSIGEIESNILLLRETFPNMCFECTGFFSPYICWKVLKKIYDYNIDSFSPDKKAFYTYYIETYSNKDFSIHEHAFCYVNTDAAPRHLIFDGEKIIPLDFERLSIGTCEISVAAFLYSFISDSCKTGDVKALWKNLYEINAFNELDESMLLSLIICRICYDLIRLDLMNVDDTHDLKGKLKQLVDNLKPIP